MKVDPVEVLRRLEWSGSYLDGTGARMGHAAEDGTFLPACPTCGGIKPQVFPYYFEGSKTKGHASDCSLAAAIQ